MQTVLLPRRWNSLARPCVTAVLIAISGWVLAAAPSARAKEAQWIWSPAFEKELAPAGTCYFRKTFNLGIPEQGTIQIACDDNYDLFVNGRLVGSGTNWKVLDTHDVTQYLVEGTNTVAVKAVNTEQGSAGLVARVAIKQQGGTHVEYSTDDTWKAALKDFPQWQKTKFNDGQWLAARSFGALGATLPWGNEITLGGTNDRFKVMPEFHVEWVIDPKETGSLICMTFDEFGQIIAARENGPLIVVHDDDQDGLVDSVSTYCSELKNCQGLLPLGGKMYAVAEGPEGAGLYRLSDEDHDRKIDRVELVLKFAGEMGEHGPHALTLGPDGLIYMLVGNFSRTTADPEPTSPYHDFYEGDLITPRYEDAGGHAVGIKAPGGSILRTDPAGSGVELFAGGLQNPYDLAFNREGELFTCDSDMEWDSGMPWYRPTRLNHVSPGSEFGWRSGWAKWPTYFVDSLPPVAEFGRGSPAGMEVYDHFMYPVRYHNALFVCDWSRGRILIIRSKPHGATYRATAETFIEGQPLNATDIAVGPDGWLYFCTGGRDTEGGIYRVVWDGKVPPSVLKRGKGLAAAIEQPQLNSAWARQRIALVKKQLGKSWTTELAALAQDRRAPLDKRLRALDLMQLFGPYPTKTLLTDISHDDSVSMRTKAAYLMGIHADDDTQSRLSEMLEDKELMVARVAAESLARSGKDVPTAKLPKLLASPDRYVSWAAGRALERAPRKEWVPSVLESEELSQFIPGAVALLRGEPNRKTVDGVLSQGGKLLKGYVSDDDFLGLMRVFQLALIKGEVKGEDVPELRAQLSDEYPSRDARMNRELVRLLVYLQEPTLAPRLVEQINGDIPSVERMQVLVHARFLTTGWTVPLKLEMLKAYEDARAIQGGHSFAGYVENVSRDFFATFGDEERQVVLAEGVKWPTSALSVLAKLPEKPSRETIEQIQQLDRQTKRLDSEAAKRLRIGICAVLGASQDSQAMAYLRDLYDTEPDRRVSIAMGLAQQPGGDNWPYLVRSISIVEGAAAQEVLMRLATVDQTPEEPEVFRQVILRGLMLRDNGSRKAIDLLEKWVGEKKSEPEEAWDKALAKWQVWFAEKYPDSPEAKLPVESEKNHWTYQELVSYLTGPQASHGVASRGAMLFEKAQCIKCHRYGSRGDTIGPDLTNVSKRFQKKEILEAILFPSQTISDQYGSKTIITKTGKTYSGMVSPRGDDTISVLQQNGEKAVIAEANIEEQSRNKVSVMPEGLLNTLTLEDIADLFAYMASQPAPETAKRPARLR